MTRSSRQKEKYRKSSEFSQDNSTPGTAARTRPFSFDEVMLRRENKKQPGDVDEAIGEASNSLGTNIIDKVSDRVESDRNKGLKHASEEFSKVSSRKKEVITSTEEGKLLKCKGKERHKSESKSKTSLKKNSIVDQAKGCEFDEWEHGNSKYNKWASNGSEKESEPRYLRSLVVKEKHSDSNRESTEKESKRKHRNEDDERSKDRNASKKHDSSNDSHKESESRHLRDLVVKDKRADRSRGNTENESKMKNRNENDDRNASQKHNSSKRCESEFPEKKEKKESFQIRNEDSRPKRRRSRSREHVKDSGRRSISLSPRAHKRMPAHSSKDRSERSNPDFDRMRISSNGSSSHHQRHDSSASRLGGYSPRKRRTEAAAAKTPSPTIRSPKKRRAGWDQPSTKSEHDFNGSALSSLQSSIPTMSSNIPEFSKIVPTALSTENAVIGVGPTASSLRLDISVDSIQLTQATRPSRRLYVENLPSSASEESIKDCLNTYVLSSGVHHMQGTHPCISCIINKEKNQALVEFLTPEDASAALSFDGTSYAGSILKIRRPKDFVDASTGVPKLSVAEVGSISNIVKDSPHKIFIGGISKLISSDMLMEIACAFGPLRAYRYEINADLNEPCAFLEYIDQAITYKACAGLNGMRLGGQVLTVVLAIPNASPENNESPPSYEIPSHAKPLLEKPTQVLKLKNMMDPEHLSSISESELDEILEDIRLECTRFGTVKSVNVVKSINFAITPPTREDFWNTVSSTDEENLECVNKKNREEVLQEGVENYDLEEIGKSEPSSNHIKYGKSLYDDRLDGLELSSREKEPEASNVVVKGNIMCEDKLEDEVVKDQLFQESSIDHLEVRDNMVTEVENELPVKEETKLEENVAEVENKLPVKDEAKLEENNMNSKGGDSSSSGFLEEDEKKEQECDEGDIVEAGCVLVEYGRTEAACMAAHGLHGRQFDERIVEVGYVSLDFYRARFPK